MPVGLGCIGFTCVSDEANRYYAHDVFSPRNPKEVELLYEAPVKPYEVIADFQARGASPDYMRKQAAKIGADAVIVGMYGGYRSRRQVGQRGQTS